MKGESKVPLGNAREGTDDALDDERHGTVGHRETERAEMDVALGDERDLTDEHDRVRMVASDEAIDQWRREHADDAIVTSTPARRRSDWVVPPLVNIAMIVLVVVWMAVVTSQVVVSTGRIADINQRQISTVQEQNDLQLCAQNDMVTAIRKIGLKLGLPVEDIVPPDVTGLTCDG